MITYFIFYSDLTYANLLSDAILKSDNNTKLVGISKKLSKNNIYNYNNILPNVIISTKESHKRLSKILNFNYYFITIPQKYTLVTSSTINKIKKLTANTKFKKKLDFYNFMEYITKEFKKLNFNLSLNGTQYLIECLMFIHQNPFFNLTRKTTKEIYCQIAKKYNINTTIVIWNINTAINDMYKYTTRKFRTKIYGRDYGITAYQIIKLFSI